METHGNILNKSDNCKFVFNTLISLNEKRQPGENAFCSDPTYVFLRRLTPPQDCVGFYTAAENRGYLADPTAVAVQRQLLGQKYGYEVPEINEDFLKEAKDPKQVFQGLEAGWLVDLKDKVIYKPTEENLKAYYKS